MKKSLQSKNSIVGPKAQIGKNVKIGDYSKISDNAVIGDNVAIGDWCKVGFDDTKNEKAIIKQNPYYGNFVLPDECVISAGSTVCDRASVCNKVIVGKDSIIGNSAYVRSHTKIGSHVIVGFGAYLGPFIEVGDGSMILNYSCIGSTTKIGKNVFMGPAVMLAENKYMLVKEYKKRKGPVIEDHVRIGCLSTVISCRVGKFSVIGANSIVRKDLPAKSFYTGNRLFT